MADKWRLGLVQQVAGCLVRVSAAAGNHLGWGNIGHFVTKRNFSVVLHTDVICCHARDQVFLILCFNSLCFVFWRFSQIGTWYSNGSKGG